MSEIKEKFCEECGKTSPVEVKYCKFCGIEFPVIDHPDYIQANAPKFSPPLQGQLPKEQFQSGQSNVPPQFPSQQQNMQSQSFPPPNDTGFLMRKPPRVWEGGGLIQASVALYSNPIETAQGLVEDPQAPNPIWIILLTALSASLVQYFTYLKTDFTELIGDDSAFFDTYASKEGIQNSAMQSATVIFLLLFISWVILSWLLALTVKNGLPVDSYLLHAPSKSMRRLTGYLYIPTMFRNIVAIVLLQFEGNREASIKKGDPILNTSAPDITYLTDFSDTYILVLFIAAIIMSIVTAMTLYRSLKYGLSHQGSTPAVIAFFVVLYSVLFFIP